MACNDTNEYPLGYADQWLRMRDTNPLGLSSISDSPAAEQDADCEYDEDQSYVEESRVRMDDGDQDVVEGEYWASGTHGRGSAQDVPPELHGFFGTVYTEYVNLLTSDQSFQADKSPRLDTRVR